MAEPIKLSDLLDEMFNEGGIMNDMKPATGAVAIKNQEPIETRRDRGKILFWTTTTIGGAATAFCITVLGLYSIGGNW